MIPTPSRGCGWWRLAVAATALGCSTAEPARWTEVPLSGPPALIASYAGVWYGHDWTPMLEVRTTPPRLSLVVVAGLRVVEANIAPDALEVVVESGGRVATVAFYFVEDDVLHGLRIRLDDVPVSDCVPWQLERRTWGEIAAIETRAAVEVWVDEVAAWLVDVL